MQIGLWLETVREQRPLVHNITNLVVTNIAANALLAIGSSPVMAYAHEEVGDMARIASALALNMGTLTPDVVEAMCIAGKAANEAGVPVVFDPVGVGATPYRNVTASAIPEEVQLTVLRANAGEMSVFLGLGGQVKGVDALSVDDALPAVMKQYAREHGVVLVATGEVDFVTDGASLWRLKNGHPLLAAITGSGCMLTAILGAFVGVAPKVIEVSGMASKAGEISAGSMASVGPASKASEVSELGGAKLRAYAEACVAAITVYNTAAELAAKRSAGPGTFQAHLFDSLYEMDGETVNEMARVQKEG